LPRVAAELAEVEQAKLPDLFEAAGLELWQLAVVGRQNGHFEE
jgi:hypothetical protein